MKRLEVAHSLQNSQLLLSLLLAIGGGCGDAQNDGVSGVHIDRAPQIRPAELEIEESDIYQQRDGRLYLHNQDSGLNVIDISVPLAPRLLGRAGVFGRAAELYLRGQQAIVLLEATGGVCTTSLSYTPGRDWGARSELVVVDVGDAADPRVETRFCLAGTPVSSRIVGDYLYVVMTLDDSGSQQVGTVLLSLDVTDPKAVQVVEQLSLEASSEQIHVTERAIFVAGRSNDPVQSDYVWRPIGDGTTRVQVVEISALDGRLAAQGSIVIEGEPQGRFHMDARGDYFRIVTYDTALGHSVLHVIDVRQPNQLDVVGKLTHIGHGERLYATRFVDQRAYVVTYRETDPLWVIDLADPHKPRLLGELRVPGWSDFIFPRGDRLVAVGRGDRGAGVGVSLFDVSDPERPRALTQVTLGDFGSGSEANTDHRAVTIVEPGDVCGGEPLLLVPYSGYDWSDRGHCGERHGVQLIDIGRDRLTERAFVELQSPVARTFVLEEAMLTLSRAQLSAVEISDRDRPVVHETLVLGAPGSDAEYGLCYGYDDGLYWHESVDGGLPFACSHPPGGAPAPLPLVVLVALALLWRSASRSRGARGTR